MATFDAWALQYVVMDDEKVMQEMAAKAAKTIEDTGAHHTTVGNWAASIGLWIAPGTDNASEGNAITRAKAIGFLTATLELLNKDLLKPGQVELLISFFGSMFSNDHKAGITPATKALQQLSSAKNFRPAMGVKIVEDVSKMKEDFRLQTAATRLEVYQLLLHVVQDPAVASELQHKYGASAGFIVDLLSMCQSERDPKNLLVWFKIISVFVSRYSPSNDVVGEIFKTFSNYFPITLRESTAQIGVTPDELKASLRECFSAHQHLAPFTFPYLIQRLDQGDSMKVTVKNDILMTMKACIDKYQNPAVSVTPYIQSIWRSLKYEVRNGEVAETVESATLVLRAIGVKFRLDPATLDQYVQLVFSDTLEDIREPNYVKQAGQLCLAVVSSSPEAFVTYSPKLVDCVIQCVPMWSSATHAPYTKDLLDLLQSALKARQALVQLYPDHETLLAPSSTTHFEDLFHKLYLPLWQNNIAAEGGPEVNVLRAVTGGVATLAKQKIVTSDGKKATLCSTDILREICWLFSHRLLMPLSLSRRDAAAFVADADLGVEEALAVVMAHCIEGFKSLVATTTELILERPGDWKKPDRLLLDHLWLVLSSVSWIGCSQLPDEVALTSGTKKYSPLHNFMAWTGALLQLTETFLTNGTDSRVVRSLVANLQHAMYSFQEAFGAETKQVNLLSDNEGPLDWAQEFKKIVGGGEIPKQWLRLLHTHDPDIHDQFWPAPSQGSEPIPDNNPDTYANFIRFSLFIIRHLFRRITKTSQGAGDGDNKLRLHLADELMAYPEKRCFQIVEQIERMGAMIIHVMDAASQEYYDLPTEAFRLFSDRAPEPPYWSVGVPEEGYLNLLTLSILNGLWPAAMTGLYKPDGIAKAILCDVTYTENETLIQTQAWIVTLLINKFKATPPCMDLKEVVQFWQTRLEQNLSSHSTDNEAGWVNSDRLESFLIGGIPRQEKAVLPLIPLVHKIIGSPDGHCLAIDIALVVDESVSFQGASHAVIKPLYKQWTYFHLVKPMIPLAAAIVTPEGDTNWYDVNRSAEHYTIATLGILAHMPFAIYESDIEPLTTMCLTSLTRWTRDHMHVENALHVLLQIMRNEPATLRYTLRSIIAALMNAYRMKLRPRTHEFPTPAHDWKQIYADNLGRVEEEGEEDNTYTWQRAERHKSTYDWDSQPSQPEPKPAVTPDLIRRDEEEQRENSKYAAGRKLVVEIIGEMPSRFEDRYLMPFKGDMNLFLDGCCADPVRELRKAAVLAKEGWFGR